MWDVLLQAVEADCQLGVDACCDFVVGDFYALEDVELLEVAVALRDRFEGV